MKVNRKVSLILFFCTWDREEGEDTQRNDTEFCKGEVHANDVYQNFLGNVGGPEHHETELRGEIISQVVRKTHKRVEQESHVFCHPVELRQR